MTVLATTNSSKTKSNSRTRSRRGKRSRNLRNNNEMETEDNNVHTYTTSMSDIQINDINDIEMSSPRRDIINGEHGECISPTVSLSNSSSSNLNENYFNNSENENEEIKTDTDTDIRMEDERRTFHFNIENDENLRNIMSTTINDYDAYDIIGNNNNNNNNLILNNNNNNNNININGANNNNINANDLRLLSNINFNSDNIEEWTSDYILSKLYNYMKISEMSKYGISVFKMTFSSYLPYLYESDLIKLATSYWCNGQHFYCMISHRGAIIRPNKCTQLKLKITCDLLDSAMQSGASVDKIEAMLKQKRIDDGIIQNKKLIKNNFNKFYQTKYERNFYLRNLKHRFWNHEVLVRVFVQNGWLSENLADTAMKTFIKTVYFRTLQSKHLLMNKQRHNRNNKQIKFSENFLHSFFVSYFCLDDIPKMYKKQILNKINSNNGKNNECFVYLNQISAETLRRWCELVELLASRGANVNEYEFRKIIPLQYALNLGKNTYKIISYSHKMKNKLFIPQTYYDENIYIPDDVWNILVSYL